MYGTKPHVAAPPETLRVTEGIAGTYHYHLSRLTAGKDGAPVSATTALCGAKVMHTHVPLAAWGYHGHLHEHYCESCGRQPEALAAIAQALLHKGAR